MAPIIRVATIQDNGQHRGAYAFDGPILEGCRADVLPGAWIRVFGTNHDIGARPFDRLFQRDDECRYDGHHRDRVGRIIGIGAKTVVVAANGIRHRLTLFQFASRNWDFAAAGGLDRDAEFSPPQR